MSSNSEQFLDHREKALRHMAAMKGLVARLMRPRGLELITRRPSDVILTVFLKSGTTLLGQMCYQIAVLSGGSCPKDPTGLEYGLLDEVVPWLENMDQFNIDPCETNPRIFKSHMTLSFFEPLECKHITCVRNPLQIPASMLNFLFDIVVQDDSVSDEVRQECVNIIMEDFILSVPPNSKDGLPNWHSQLKEVVESKDEKILLLFYEQVLHDMRGTIVKVAKFMGCELSEADVSTVLDRCDRNYMAADPKFKGTLGTKALKMPVAPSFTQPSHFVGFKKFEVADSLKLKLEKAYQDVFGVRTYQEIMDKYSTQKFV